MTNDSGHVGRFELDLVARTVTYDDEMRALLEIPRDWRDLALEDVLSAFAAEDRDRVGTDLVSAVAAGGTYANEYRLRVREGRTRWLAVRGHVELEAGGRAIRLLGTAVEITSLLAESDRVVRVLESMSNGYLQMDRDWRVTYVNAEAERLLASAREHMLGRTMWELYPATVGTDFERAYRQAVSTGERVVFDAYYPAPLDTWYELRAEPVEDGMALYFLDINERKRAQERTELVSTRLAALTDLILELHAAKTVEELSLFVVERALAGLGAVGGSVSLITEEGTVLRALISGALGSGTQQRYSDLPMSSALPAAVAARTGLELLMGDRAAAVGVSAEMGAVVDGTGCEAWACLPLEGESGRLGTLVVAWADPRDIDDDELAVLRAFALQCAQSLERMRQRDAEQDRTRSAVNLAEALQRSLLTEPRQAGGVQIAVRYRAAVTDAQIGGDWYDSFVNGEGRTCLVVGDATGHDKDAAAVMGQVRNLLRGIAYTVGEPPAAILSRLDGAMRDLDVDSLATALLATLDTQGGSSRLCWSNAGHLPPLLLEPGQPPRVLAGEPDLLLGLDPATTRSGHEQVLTPGSTVLLFTDGLVERRGASIDDGLAWLGQAADALRDRPLDALCDALLSEVAGAAEDDIALLAVRVDAS